MKIGYKEEEIRHMHYGKWSDLFFTHQQMHDFGDKKFNQDKDTQKEKQVHSLMEL